MQESSSAERDLVVLVSRKWNEAAACPGSRKGQPCPGLHQAWHCWLGEGRACAVASLPALGAAFGATAQKGYIGGCPKEGYKHEEGSGGQPV